MLPPTSVSTELTEIALRPQAGQWACGAPALRLKGDWETYFGANVAVLVAFASEADLL